MTAQFLVLWIDVLLWMFLSWHSSFLFHCDDASVYDMTVNFKCIFIQHLLLDILDECNFYFELYRFYAGKSVLRVTLATVPM